MNIAEISEKYGVPVKKLKRLEKAGLLSVTASDERPARMRKYLSGNQMLSVAQMVDIIHEPGLAAHLAGWRDKADEQIESLGDYRADALPDTTAANLIYGCAVVDPASLGAMLEWLKATIPEGGCTYHYIAVRMMLHVPAHRRAQTYKFLPRAILNIRNHPAFLGWSEKDIGEQTKFVRGDLSLDL